MKRNETIPIPQGYKATPLGIIPQEWEVKRLGDLCCNQGDYGINAPAVAYSNDLPTYLRITDISDDGKFIIDNKASVNSPNSKNYHLEEGDIVFARTGATVGKTYLYDPADGDLVFAGFLIRFSPNERKIIPYYLKTYTDTAAYWYWVKIISQRSGQPGINAAEYSSLQLPVPPLAEQRKIAEVLGLWDKAIEKQSQLIEQLTLRKRGLMQQLLTAKRRLPGFSGPWKEVKLGEISKIGTGNKNNEDKVANGKYPFFVRSSNIERINSYSYDGEAILIPGEGKIGEIIHYVNGKFDYHQRVYKISNFSNCLGKYLYYYLMCFFGKQAVNNSVKACVDSLRLSTFTNMKILYPSFEEQTAIAQVLTAADREIELAQQKLELLRQQKRGLMQQLLTGKKRVKI